jgi:putative heme-binding domain-containing protein
VPAPDDPRHDAVLDGLGAGLARSGGRLDPSHPVVAAWLARAEARARDARAAEPARVRAVGALACAPFGFARETLVALLDPQAPGAVQAAALRALAGYPEPEVAGLVLSRLRRLAPAARGEAVATLLAREPWTLALLKAARDGAADPAAIDPARRALLVAHKNPEVASLARALFGAPGGGGPGGKDVLAAFAPALASPGDAARGSAVFEKLCSTCHRLGGRGHAVGPDLTATQFGEPEALLTHVLDPNRYVAPNYVQYVVSDKSGRVFTGLIASETASSLTLRRAEGAEDTILRNQVDELTSTGKSLMPDDLASRLSPRDAADLVAFLLQSRSPAPQAESGRERLDIGTLPGLIEPEDARK